MAEQWLGNQWSGEPESPSNMSSDCDRNSQSSRGGSTFEALKAMFQANIDSDVIEMIWQNCNGNGDIAFNLLNEINPVKLLQPGPVLQAAPLLQPALAVDPVPAANGSWSKILGTNSDKPFVEVQSAQSESVQNKVKNSVVEVLHERIWKNERILVLMRGVPGSGKTHLARQIKGRGVVLSTDDFFYNRYGDYYFDPRCLSEAHEWNRKRAERALRAGSNPVVIDNTNLESWEMQPYVFMALRFSYSIELVEPDTPWRNNVRILSEKNVHGVPRDKIALMLEKQQASISITAVVEDCRRKLNLPPCVNQPLPSPSSPNRSVPEKQQPFDLVKSLQRDVSNSVQNEDNRSIRTNSSCSNNREDASSLKDQMTSEKNEAVPQSPPLQSSAALLPDVAASASVLSANSSVVSVEVTSVAVQTSISAPTIGTRMGRSRSIQTSRLAPIFNRKPTSKCMLDKGCNTEEVVEDLASRKALSILKSYFPTMDAEDLADVLDRCNGDLTWAVNLLLDSGYECAQEVFVEEEIPADEEPDNANIVLPAECAPLTNGPSLQVKDDETYSCTSSDTSSSQQSSVRSAPSDEVESVRKHVEECFKLTDTISDHARRICGKDYGQFRASQLSKARHSQMAEATMPPTTSQHMSPADTLVTNNFAGSGLPVMSEEALVRDYDRSSVFRGGPEYGVDLELYEPQTTDIPPIPGEEVPFDGGAMIPMTLDPSFVTQLVSLFGAPDLKTNGASSISTDSRVSFDIPWTLAEQIYMHWCASLVSEEDEAALAAEEENRELQSIMDVELAIKVAEDEKNAQQKELRESLSTKLSIQMLRENYPSVDPSALDALFKANNYNYAHTVEALNASLGTKPRPQKPLEPSQPQTPSKDSTSQKREMRVVEARDLRADAYMYNRLKQEYAAKAQENHQRGMSAVATYYASESRRYAELYKECNQKAALQILEEKNAQQNERTIDLHELHVQEALSCLESFIAETTRDGKTVVQVITGRGNNSQNGKPKIKPAVIHFLRRKKYAFEEINPGMLRVFLRRAARHVQ